MPNHVFSASRSSSLALTLILSASLLAGCQAFGTESFLESSAPAELSAPAAAAMAGDLVPRLAEQIGQGTATIALKPDNSAFGSALESSLRAWGYAVTTDQGAKDANIIQLAYVLAPVDGLVLARLSTQSVEIGRVYSASATGAAPSSPLSVMRRG